MDISNEQHNINHDPEAKYTWPVSEEFEGYIDHTVSDLPERDRLRIGRSIAYAYTAGREQAELDVPTTDSDHQADGQPEVHAEEQHSVSHRALRVLDSLFKEHTRREQLRAAVPVPQLRNTAQIIQIPRKRRHTK